MPTKVYHSRDVRFNEGIDVAQDSSSEDEAVHDDAVDSPVGGVQREQLRRSTRTTARPVRLIESYLADLQGYVKANASFAAEEPRTIKEALGGPDSSKWELAIAEELDAHHANGTWEMCELTCQHAFRNKRRLVARLNRDYQNVSVNC